MTDQPGVPAAPAEHPEEPTTHPPLPALEPPRRIELPRPRRSVAPVIVMLLVIAANVLPALLHNLYFTNGNFRYWVDYKVTANVRYARALAGWALRRSWKELRG